VTKAKRDATAQLLADAQACTHCSADLPHEPRPVLRIAAGARVVLIGQAPGAKVHESGRPWEDDSGLHLRSWLGVEETTFNDTNAFAMLPMGFCFPGRRKGGDLPPRPECAPLWHDRILKELHDVRLIILIGQYAVNNYLVGTKQRTLGDTVRAFADYLPQHFPLPHPSWRSKIWMKKNPWFEDEVLPQLQDRVRQALR
jgi:uracil-DNA glycosylase